MGSIDVHGVKGKTSKRRQLGKNANRKTSPSQVSPNYENLKAELWDIVLSYNPCIVIASFSLSGSRDRTGAAGGWRK